MSLVPFTFEDQAVRVIELGGNPWFMLADVCMVLDIANSGNAAARLDDDEKGIHIVDTLGGEQGLTVVSESGLWSLVLTSRKPNAKAFKKWITAEVIPSIRRTGSYGADPMRALNDPAAMRGLLLTYSEKVLALETENAELAPKAAALHRIAEADGSMCVTDAAKTLQVRPGDLFKFLRSHSWIYKRVGTDHEVAYQSKLVSGLLEHKTTTVHRSDGSEKITTQVRVTTKGLARLAQEFQPAVKVA